MNIQTFEEMKKNYLYDLSGPAAELTWWAKGTTVYKKNEQSTSSNKIKHNSLVCHEKVFFCSWNFNERERKKNEIYLFDETKA